MRCHSISAINLKVMCNLLVTALIIALLLIVSGNVKLNPGPMKKCSKCEKMMPTRSNNCKCGYLLCYVAARVLHFSAFILSCVCTRNIVALQCIFRTAAELATMCYPFSYFILSEC